MLLHTTRPAFLVAPLRRLRRWAGPRSAGLTLLALAVLAGASAIAYVNVQALSGASTAVARTREVRENLNLLTSRLSDAESGRAAWVRTGRHADLAEWRSAVIGIDEALDVIERLVADNAAQISRLERVEVLVRTRLSDLGKGAMPGARTEAANRDIAEQLRRLLGDMLGEEDRALDRRLAEFDSARRVTVATTAALGLLCALLLGGLQYRAWRYSRRLLDLNAALARNQAALREALEREKELAAERLKVEEALRVADRRKDEFLAMLSHELRNPLAPIRNAIELVRRLQGDDARARDATAVLQRQVTHMVRLVEDLLDVSRIKLGTIRLEVGRVDAGEVLRDALEASRPLLEGGRHSVALQIPEQPVYIRGDATRLTQVVTNLLNNAAKYTPRGGRIVLRIARGAREVEIAVADNGLGIPEEKLGGVFEMFNRLGRSESLSRGGLGVGLALSKTIVEMHDGSIEARSAGAGRGSEFVVRVPAAEEAVASVHSLVARRRAQASM